MVARELAGRRRRNEVELDLIRLQLTFALQYTADGSSRQFCSDREDISDDQHAS